MGEDSGGGRCTKTLGGLWQWCSHGAAAARDRLAKLFGHHNLMRMGRVEAVVNEAEEAVEALRERRSSEAALLVAVIATFMALCGVKVRNLDNALVQHKSSAIDMWSMFQAKSMKQYMFKLERDTLEAMVSLNPQATTLARGGVIAKLRRYDREIARYEVEKADAMKSARGYEAAVAEMSGVHALLDLAEVFLSVAIALLAITILTRLRWVMMVSLFPAFLGIFFGLAGLAGWPLHVTLPHFLG